MKFSGFARLTFYALKYVDIHTHNQVSDSNKIVVRNLSLSDAEKFVASDASGFISVGIHPWDLERKEQEDDRVDRLRKMATDQRVVLIGECGLDKNIGVLLEKQVEVFSKHISLSESLKKPLIIHCVRCFNELMELKKQYNPKQKWIVHGFRGKPQLAEQLLRAGMDLSFGEKFNPESVVCTPPDRLFVETDESNLPIETIYEKISALKGCKTGDLSAGKVLLKI